jgi:hypothetical protein
MNIKYPLYILIILTICAMESFAQNKRLTPDKHPTKTKLSIVGTSPLITFSSRVYLGLPKQKVLSNIKALGSHPYELLDPFTIKVYEDDLILASNTSAGGKVGGIKKYKGVVLYEFNKANICEKITLVSDEEVFFKRYYFFKNTFKEIDGATWIEVKKDSKIVWKIFKVEALNNKPIIEASLL